MKNLNSKAPLGSSLIVLSSLFYASYDVWTTLMGEFFGGYTASALRSILVLAILIPLALFYRKLGKISFKNHWLYFVGLILSATLIWGPYYYAVLHASVGISLVINYACVIIGMFIFGKLLTKKITI